MQLSRKAKETRAIPLDVAVRLADLKGRGFELIIADYEGGGDEGGINSVVGWRKPPTKRNRWDPPPRGLTESLAEEDDNMFTFFNELLDAYYPGFGNGEGGNGTITVTLESMSVVIEHNQEVTSYEQEQHEFELVGKH